MLQFDQKSNSLYIYFCIVEHCSAIISGKDITAEHDLLQPVSLQVSLVRNLSTSWYHGHANLELSGRLKSLSVRRIQIICCSYMIFRQQDFFDLQGVNW